MDNSTSTDRDGSVKPRVVADANIPYLEELLGDSVRLIRLAPAEITVATVKEADALITRTRTICNAPLLDGSRCRFIATATIGTDHIDFGYCASRGITVASAPGCNAPAVAQYVLAALMRLIGQKDPATLTLGIIGVGHVGTIVARWAEALGFNILRCDPPRADAEGDFGFVSLDEVAARADIITFHTPHTFAGQYPTHHLADDSFFKKLSRKPVIINSARGPIIDTAALLRAIDDDKVGQIVIDCWEGEPDISLPLLAKATYATPHIAGYSSQGKARASLMAAKALSDYFGLRFAPSIPVPADPPASVTAATLLDSYDPAVDTIALRANPDQFETLRNRYHLRSEPTAS